MPEDSMKFRLKYVVEDTDRHGNIRLYYRRHGRKVRLRGPAGSPEFLADYKAASAGPAPTSKDEPPVGRVVPRSIKWLCVEYYKSAMFKELDPRTQKVRRSILERFCQRKDDGDKPYALLGPKHIRTRRDEMADRPEAANGMVKALRQLYRFALRYDHHDDNPAEKVEYLSGNAEGFHSWTLEEIAKFEEKHPIGTTARLALALALYTGQRRADLVQLGRQHVRDGWLIFTQHKGRNRKPVRMEIPIIPELQRIIDATPTGDLTYLVTAFNRPFTSNGFGNRFRKWCDEAELPNCAVHGLRKAAAARLAELGCTEFEIMAITGHTTSKEVTRYTRAASQKTRAESALRRLTGEQTPDKSVPLSEAVAAGGTKSTPKQLKRKG
ncbi:integrase [Primorskyibacter flagellatus]|uniref:Integrase n=1 Tax=Primorskyibacter flagellatus TaxID=1387277 RepID=A0A917EA96_9RHOB|nr:tyrosine-type recombinase/integrase [Primorskyibacter flagellatus]GGE18778.1 integrase [Primorskyibacter flagellatus]